MLNLSQRDLRSATSIDAEKTNELVYETVGQIVSLLSHSPMHRHFTVKDITDLIMPSVIWGQYRVFRNEHNSAIGFGCWGFFSDQAKQKFLGCKEVLTFEDWNSGKDVFVTDFIAPFGHATKIVKQLKYDIFPNDVVYALRYEAVGSPRSQLSTFLWQKRKSSVQMGSKLFIILDRKLASMMCSSLWSEKSIAIRSSLLRPVLSVFISWY